MCAASVFVAGRDPELARRIETFAGARMVFLAGLPGTGKSFLAHQVAHLASERGRTVHLLQWDVARPVFEASDAGRRYPVRDGATHAIVRKAVGRWARRAVVAWSERHADAGHLLIGETPFVGNRFIELARPRDDQAEPLLRAPACRFAIPVPSPTVRTFLESERERRTAQPLHPREREDAPPAVLRDLWRELVRVAAVLGIPCAGRERVDEAENAPGPDSPPMTWDAELYRGVYEAVLRHRHVDVVRLDTVLDTSSMSVYEHAVVPRDVVPTAEEAQRFIALVEQRYPSLAALDREIERWYAV